MKKSTFLLYRQLKASSLFLAVGFAALMLLSGWLSTQTHASYPQPEGRSIAQYAPTGSGFSRVDLSTPATDTITSTLYLPVVNHSIVQTVTILAAQPAWTANWWQWISRLNSIPIYQQGTVDCGLGQTGDVWFLAGSEGNSPIVRKCAVPPNKTFVVPLQTIAWANEGAEDLTVPEKRAVLDSVYSDAQPGPLNTKICRLESSVNGEVVSNERLESPPFLYKGDPEAVADGFWYAFKLISGTHTVKFRGTLCDFNNDTPTNDIAVTYTILVDSGETSPGVKWQLFVWNTNIKPEATGCSPSDPDGVVPCDAVSLGRNSIYAATPPWHYEAPDAGAVLTVVDTASSGDQFEVFDNNVSFGFTSPARGDADCPVPEGGDPGVCLEQPGMSFGTFVLGPGAHSITIKPVTGSFVGVGYFRIAPATSRWHER